MGGVGKRVGSRVQGSGARERQRPEGQKQAEDEGLRRQADDTAGARAPPPAWPGLCQGPDAAGREAASPAPTLGHIATAGGDAGPPMAGDAAGGLRPAAVPGIHAFRPRRQQSQFKSQTERSSAVPGIHRLTEESSPPNGRRAGSRARLTAGGQGVEPAQRPAGRESARPRPQSPLCFPLSPLSGGASRPLPFPAFTPFRRVGRQTETHSPHHVLAPFPAFTPFQRPPPSSGGLSPTLRSSAVPGIHSVPTAAAIIGGIVAYIAF
jgi:hypothetical protein